MVVNYELINIRNAAQLLVDAVLTRKVVAFHGDMGTGKTTLIHEVCSVLQVNDTVSSPTFSIINEYRSETGNTIIHMDLYRLKGEEEAIIAGVEDAMYSGNLCLVEWPENAERLFPEDTVHCYLTSTGSNERQLKINL